MNKHFRDAMLAALITGVTITALVITHNLHVLWLMLLILLVVQS